MGTKVAKTSGLWSGSNWYACDDANSLRSEANANNVSTTFSYSLQFSVSAGTYRSIVLFQAMRSASPAGTITIGLYKGPSGSQVLVAGTQVTINATDLSSVGTTAVRDPGPVQFLFPSPVVLAAGSDYWIGSQSSNSGTVGFWNNGTSNNFSRVLVLDTLSTPAAGDDFILAAERTGSGSFNSVQITYDGTTSTIWGSGGTTGVVPAIAISKDAALVAQKNAATNYLMRINGRFHLHFDGTLDIGNSLAKIPNNSTFEIEFVVPTNAAFGFQAYHQYNLSADWDDGFGSDSNGDSNAWCRLTSTLNSGNGSGAGSVQVENTTGWRAGDELEIGTTRVTGSGFDSLNVSAIADSTSLSLSANASFVHDGDTVPQTPRAYVANLTRGIIIRGSSASLQSWFILNYSNSGPAPASPNVSINGVSFKWLGSANTGQRGVEVFTVGGTVSFNNCVFRNFVVSSSRIQVQIRNSAGVVNFTNCVFVQYHTTILFSGAGSSAEVPTTKSNISHNLFCRNTSGNGVELQNTKCLFNRNFVCNTNTHLVGVNLLLAFNEPDVEFNDNEGIIGQNNGGFLFGDMPIPSISNLYAGRCQGGNINSAHIVFNTSEVFESIISGLKIEPGATGQTGITFARGKIRLVNPVIGSASFAFSNAIRLGISVNNNGGSWGSRVVFEGGTITNSTNIILGVNYCATEMTMIGVSTSIAPGITQFFSGSVGFISGFVQLLNHGGIAGQNFAYVPRGSTTGATYVLDTTIFNSSSPSLAIYPGSASQKVKSPTFSVAVASGQSVTPSISVRESVVGDGAAYNGNPPRLIVKRNYLAGITSDTVLDVHSGTAGVWESLSGSTISVSRDCVLEFCIDCDGTAGWINVDDFSCVSADSTGMKFFSESKLSPWVVGGSSGGGGSQKPQNPFLNTVIG